MEPSPIRRDDLGTDALRMQNTAGRIAEETLEVQASSEQRTRVIEATPERENEPEVDRRRRERRRLERRAARKKVLLDTRLSRERRREVRRGEDQRTVAVYANSPVAQEIDPPNAVKHRGVDLEV